MEEAKKYNFDDAIANEETTKVQSAAVTRAKQKSLNPYSNGMLT